MNLIQVKNIKSFGLEFQNDDICLYIISSGEVFLRKNKKEIKVLDEFYLMKTYLNDLVMELIKIPDIENKSFDSSKFLKEYISEERKLKLKKLQNDNKE